VSGGGSTVQIMSSQLPLSRSYGYRPPPYHTTPHSLHKSTAYNSMQKEGFLILQCFDGGVYRSESLGFRALSTVQCLRLALSKGPDREGVFLTSLEDRNRSSFRKVLFYSYLEFRAMARSRNPIILSNCTLPCEKNVSYKPAKVSISQITKHKRLKWNCEHKSIY
jgi:hypothetical protein